MQIQKLDPIAQLDFAIRASYRVIWIVSQEEARVESAIRSLGVHPKHASKDFLTWSVARGIRDAREPTQDLGKKDPVEALEYVALRHGVTKDRPEGKPAIALFKGLHPFLTAEFSRSRPQVLRALQDAMADLATIGLRTIVVIAPGLSLPDEIARNVAVIEWPLPTVQELTEALDGFIATTKEKIPVELNGDREQLARALSGLTMFQALSVLAMAAIANGRLDQDAIDFIVQEKARLIKASGVVEFYQPEGLPEIGGLDLLKEYLRRRRRAFSDEARVYGAPTPKGLLLVGVPGTGKSLACKTLARMWRLPLIRLDVGSLMGSLLGESEDNLRQALQVAESAAPAILWLDEIEKGLAGVSSGGRSDAGTTDKMFSYLLTWMQEKSAPVYLVATSNDISALPPELLRAGRFDDIFFVDLPNPSERQEIWRIHLRHVGRDPAQFDLDALVEASAGYTGAEIEASVAEALYAGFDESREIETTDLEAAIRGRVPLTDTMAERLQAMRTELEKRAKPASSQPERGAARATPASRAAQLDF